MWERQWKETRQIKNFKESISESLNGLDQNVSRILDFKETASEVLKENEKNPIENRRKGDPYYVVA